MTKTLRARLTLWYLLTVTIVLAVFATLLYVSIFRSLYAHHDEELVHELERLLDRLAAADPAQPSRALDGGPGLPMYVLLRSTTSGDPIYISPRLRELTADVIEDPELLRAARLPPEGTRFLTVQLGGRTFRFASRHTPQSSGTCLQVGRPLGEVDRTLASIRTAALILVPVVALLTSFGGLFIARRALAPIEDIAETIRQIQSTSLSQRLHVQPGGQELAQLEAAVNQLLVRLEGAFTSLREFTADVSHELQTPLTIIKGSLELALRERWNSPSSRVTLEEITREVDGMAATLANLRSLSLADEGAGDGAGEADFSSVCSEAVEIATALGEPKDVTIEADVANGVVVWGNAVRLKEVILNLLENAIKYSPAGGRVYLSLQVDGHDVVISVSDNGSGIDEGDIGRVFDRRFRGHANQSTPGSGLGLAIAKRIVETHGGTIGVRNRSVGGAEFIVRLPVRPGLS